MYKVEWSFGLKPRASNLEFVQEPSKSFKYYFYTLILKEGAKKKKEKNACTHVNSKLNKGGSQPPKDDVYRMANLVLLRRSQS